MGRVEEEQSFICGEGWGKAKFDLKCARMRRTLLRVCQRLRERKLVEQFSDVLTRKITCKIEFIAVAC